MLRTGWSKVVERNARASRTRRRVPLQVESLEDRVTPVTTINVLPSTFDLIKQIDLADQAQGPVVLNLAPNYTYVLVSLDDTHFNREDNNWYGPNGLPAIDNDITINGQGATIERADGAPNFRLFYVSGGSGGVGDNTNTLPQGILTLNDLTLEGGVAKGGDGGP